MREIGRRRGRRGLLAALAVAFLAGSLLTAARRPAQSADDGVTLTVSAAADLTPAFEELGRLFEKQTGVEVEFNFGSTGQLAQQIEAGAPVDVFAAANVAYVERLDEQGLILPDTKAVYARGRIVLWTRADGSLAVDDLGDLARPEVERVAIANPEHAPYGIAARESMQSAGVWDAVQDKLVLAENVRDTLRYAETGNVDVAVVALSLVIQGEGTWTLVPEELHEPIDQALAVIKATRHEPEARAFAAFASNEQGREVIRRYGFLLPDEAIPATAGTATPDAGTSVP